MEGVTRNTVVSSNSYTIILSLSLSFISTCSSNYGGIIVVPPCYWEVEECNNAVKKQDKAARQRVVGT